MCKLLVRALAIPFCVTCESSKFFNIQLLLEKIKLVRICSGRKQAKHCKNFQENNQVTVMKRCVNIDVINYILTNHKSSACYQRYGWKSIQKINKKCGIYTKNTLFRYLTKKLLLVLSNFWQKNVVVETNNKINIVKRFTTFSLYSRSKMCNIDGQGSA